MEKTEEEYEQGKDKERERKFKKNEFTIKDFAEQIKAIKKMGSLGDLIGMIPGLKKVAGEADSEETKREPSRIQALIYSLTHPEGHKHLEIKRRPPTRKTPPTRTSAHDLTP